MRVFYLSDLHLRDGADPASRRFEAFLHELPSGGDTLILGGDIFDLFVGDKAVFRRKFAGILEAIRDLAQKGGKVHYLEGNHDFHMQSVFSGTGNIALHQEDFSFSQGGRRILVSHGDLIDPEDKGYRLLRRVTRHPLFRLLVKLMPGSWIDAIGNRSSKESRKYNHSEKGGDENRKRLRTLYLNFAKAAVKGGQQHVLVGHSHLADQVKISEEGKEGEYLNLGFSADRLVYGCLEEGAESFVVRSYPG